ncbi:hypothetical protein PSP31121_05342 [Pandoraea sputorum]|uniref:Uncharacterized protein n=1 Tax=Pandoraea sputorum TaxID=93222 RepID=A0A5E5BIW5_9BURK|nr:hypothetical protein PSP31121_05342 [Pandoraea sputorum]
MAQRDRAHATYLASAAAPQGQGAARLKNRERRSRAQPVLSHRYRRDGGRHHAASTALLTPQRHRQPPHASELGRRGFVRAQEVRNLLAALDPLPRVRAVFRSSVHSPSATANSTDAPADTQRPRARTRAPQGVSAARVAPRGGTRVRLSRSRKTAPNAEGGGRARGAGLSGRSGMARARGPLTPGAYPAPWRATALRAPRRAARPSCWEAHCESAAWIARRRPGVDVAPTRSTSRKAKTRRSGSRYAPTCGEPLSRPPTRTGPQPRRDRPPGAPSPQRGPGHRDHTPLAGPTRGTPLELTYRGHRARPALHRGRLDDEVHGQPQRRHQYRADTSDQGHGLDTARVGAINEPLDVRRGVGHLETP